MEGGLSLATPDRIIYSGCPRLNCPSVSPPSSRSAFYLHKKNRLMVLHSALWGSRRDGLRSVQCIRTQIGMFRPIRMDHTNCLQVAIKTHHQFIDSLSRQSSVVKSSRNASKGLPILVSFVPKKKDVNPSGPRKGIRPGLILYPGERIEPDNRGGNNNRTYI